MGEGGHVNSVLHFASFTGLALGRFMLVGWVHGEGVRWDGKGKEIARLEGMGGWRKGGVLDMLCGMWWCWWGVDQIVMGHMVLSCMVGEGAKELGWISKAGNCLWSLEYWSCSTFNSMYILLLVFVCYVDLFLEWCALLLLSGHW